MEKNPKILFVFLKSDVRNQHELNDFRFLYRVWSGWAMGHSLVRHFGQVDYNPNFAMSENQFTEICKDNSFVGVTNTMEIIDICAPFEINNAPEFNEDDTQFWRISFHPETENQYQIDVETLKGHKNKRHLNIDVLLEQSSGFLTIFVRNIKDYSRTVTQLNKNKKGDKLFLPIFGPRCYEYFIRPHKNSMGEVDFHNCVAHTDDFILQNQMSDHSQFLTYDILSELHKQPDYFGCICVMDVYHQHLFIASPNQGEVHYRMFFHYQKNKFNIYAKKINPNESIDAMEFKIEKFMGIEIFRVVHV